MFISDTVRFLRKSHADFCTVLVMLSMRGAWQSLDLNTKTFTTHLLDNYANASVCVDFLVQAPLRKKSPNSQVIG